MTRSEVRQQLKNEALKKIREIYNPKSSFKCDPYDEGSYGEQKGYAVQYIIEDLEKNLVIVNNS